MYNTHFSLAIWILDILEVGSSISITLSVTDSEINFRLIKEIAFLKEINSTQFLYKDLGKIVSIQCTEKKTYVTCEYSIPSFNTKIQGFDSLGVKVQ